MEPDSGADAAEVFDFVDEYLRDRESGATRTLADYLARYPGHEETIAREYFALEAERQGAAPHGNLAADPVPSAGIATTTQARLVGSYRLLRELGRGGQGAVWLAEDSRIARRVALKLLPPAFAALSTDRRRRLQREAELIARLEHPSICTILEAQVEGDSPYIAMRYVEGETLASAIQRARESGPGAAPARGGALRLPARDVLDLRALLLFFERIARALHAAHEAGVIHRDIKPGNLMVTPQGEPVVLDFGASRDERSGSSDLTLTGEVYGTPAYMSPEQVGGRGRVDRRTDVWALGASLFEALTLRRPFDRPSKAVGGDAAKGAGGDQRSIPELLAAIQTQPVPDARAFNPAVTQELQIVLQTALEKDVARRYASALELAEDLRRIREYEPIRARPASAGLVLRRWIQRNPVLAVSVATVVTSLALGLAWSLYLLSREQVALDHVLGRHLAQRAERLVREDPSAALALALDAVERDRDYETRAALFSALEACQLERVLDCSETAHRVLDGDLAPDSERAVLALDDKTARVFELSSGRTLLTLAHPAAVTCVRFDAAGETLASGCEDGRLRLWNARSGGLLLETEGPRGASSPISDLEFTPGGHIVVASAAGVAIQTGEEPPVRLPLDALTEGAKWRVEVDSRGGLLLVWSELSPTASGTAGAAPFLWDLPGGTLRAGLRGDQVPVVWAEFCADGRSCLTASRDGTVRVWSTATGKPAGAALALGAGLTCARFSPDGSSIAAAGEGGAWICSLADATRTPLFGPEPARTLHVAFAPATAADPSGSRIATASVDLTLRVWSARDGALLATHPGLMQPQRALWTRDGGRVVTLSNGAQAHVWFARNRPDVYTLAKHAGPITSVEFRSDGERALTSSEDGTARIWSTPSAGHREAVPGALLLTLAGHTASVRRARFSPDGSLALTLSDDGTARLWDAESGSPRGEPLAHDSPVVDGVFSPDGLRIATVSGDGRARVLEVARPARARVLEPAGTAQRVLFSLDGASVITGDSDDCLRVWRASDGELLRTASWKSAGNLHGVVELALSPSGSELAVACIDQPQRGLVRFFDPLSERDVRPQIKLFVPQSVVYSRDGSRLLVTGPFGRGAIQLHDLASNTKVKTEIYHAADVTGGWFSPDGSLVLTTAKDGGAYVRNASDGSPVASVTGRAGPIVCGAFSPGPGELRVITGSADGTARVWPVDPEPAARARQPRPLLDWERAREARLALPLEYH
jgi:eukaryotic-like serine/threonine-protein kinase